MSFRPPDSPKADVRPKDELMLMATNCLGCLCAEGGAHKTDCVFRQDTGGAYAQAKIKSLQIDLKQLISGYGLVARYATLDAHGTLTVYGPSKER